MKVDFIVGDEVTCVTKDKEGVVIKANNYGPYPILG